jgi:hypothetical protein
VGSRAGSLEKKNRFNVSSESRIRGKHSRSDAELVLPVALKASEFEIEVVGLNSPYPDVFGNRDVKHSVDDTSIRGVIACGQLSNRRLGIAHHMLRKGDSLKLIAGYTHATAVTRVFMLRLQVSLPIGSAPDAHRYRREPNNGTKATGQPPSGSPPPNAPHQYSRGCSEGGCGHLCLLLQFNKDGPRHLVSVVIVS